VNCIISSPVYIILVFYEIFIEIVQLKYLHFMKHSNLTAFMTILLSCERRAYLYL